MFVMSNLPSLCDGEVTSVFLVVYAGNKQIADKLSNFLVSKLVAKVEKIVPKRKIGTSKNR